LGTLEAQLSHIKLLVVLAAVDSFVKIDSVQVFIVFLYELDLALNLNLIGKICAIRRILNRWLRFISS